jgi:hypothetical protein
MRWAIARCIPGLTRVSECVDVTRLMASSSLMSVGPAINSAGVRGMGTICILPL